MSQMETTDTTDEIILEVRRIKETLAEQENFDLDRILESARRDQQTGGRKIIPASN
jgi:hypothetical protein